MRVCLVGYGAMGKIVEQNLENKPVCIIHNEKNYLNNLEDYKELRKLCIIKV